MKVSELIGGELDYWVAKALGNAAQLKNSAYDEGAYCMMHDKEDGKFWIFQPSEDWSDGGPIIEQERIDVRPCRNDWVAYYGKECGCVYAATPLVAAMQAFVAAKFGEDVSEI